MSREHIIVAQQPETQVYPGETGYIVIKQTNWPEDPSVIVLDSIHAQVVANAILACAEKPHRNLRVGGAAKMFTSMEKMAPALADRQKMTAFEAQQTDLPPHREGALYKPVSGDLAVRGNYPGRVRTSSLYTRGALHPMAALMSVAAVGVGIAVAMRNGRN